MKFGLEAEKFIFDVKRGVPSESVFSLLDALSDFDGNLYQSYGNFKATNEFVLSMVEFGTSPSANPLHVLKDYLFNYLMIKDVSAREQVSMVPLAALPMEYLPHMTPKRSYYIQNSVLSGEKKRDWMMSATSPLKAAGNCAGIHMHAQIETPHEFLFSNDELKNKFNMGLMLSPMIAFSSSPYFFSVHEGKSMRGLRYYQGVYGSFPLNGGLPPVMKSSSEALAYVQESSENWISKGVRLGFDREEMEIQILNKSANWNPVRWNRRWNTIEIRCLDSDSFEMDSAKFIWLCGAMKRMDLKGEHLQCREISSEAKVDRHMIEDAFSISGNEVRILSTEAIRDLFERAMIFGTKDELVEAYLHRLGAFAQGGLHLDEMWIFERLTHVLNSHETSSELLLSKTQGSLSVSDKEAVKLVTESIARNDWTVESLKSQTPDIFKLLEDASGGRSYV